MFKIFLLFLLLHSSMLKAQKTASFFFNKGFNYLTVDKTISIDFFTQSLAADPEFSLAYYYRGLANYKEGNYQLAINDFDKTLATDENMVKCYMYKGFAYQQLDQLKNALVAFENYIGTKKEISSSDHIVLAKAKTATGDLKGALKEYQKSLDEEASEEQLYRLFLATYNQKKYKEALELINEIIQLNHSFYGYYLHRGKVEINLKHFDKAIKNFDLSQGLNPEVADNYFLKANTLDTLGRFDEAIINYSTAIQLNPSEGTYYSKRGNSKITLGDKNGACLDWTIAGKLGYYADFDKIKTVCEQTKVYSK